MFSFLGLFCWLYYPEMKFQVFRVVTSRLWDPTIRRNVRNFLPYDTTSLSSNVAVRTFYRVYPGILPDVGVFRSCAKIDVGKWTKWICCKHVTSCWNVVCRESSVCITTCYELDCLGIEYRLRRDLPHPSNKSWGPPGVLYNEYRVSFPGVKRPGRCVNHPSRLDLHGFFRVNFLSKSLRKVRHSSGWQPAAELWVTKWWISFQRREQKSSCHLNVSCTFTVPDSLFSMEQSPSWEAKNVLSYSRNSPHFMEPEGS
jgi:hypothetical protein